jgi:hypothetical protein
MAVCIGVGLMGPGHCLNIDGCSYWVLQLLYHWWLPYWGCNWWNATIKHQLSESILHFVGQRGYWLENGVGDSCRCLCTSCSVSPSSRSLDLFLHLSGHNICTSGSHLMNCRMIPRYVNLPLHSQRLPLLIQVWDVERNLIVIWIRYQYWARASYKLSVCMASIISGCEDISSQSWIWEILFWRLRMLAVTWSYMSWITMTQHHRYPFLNSTTFLFGNKPSLTRLFPGTQPLFNSYEELLYLCRKRPEGRKAGKT